MIPKVPWKLDQGWLPIRDAEGQTVFDRYEEVEFSRETLERIVLCINFLRSIPDYVLRDCKLNCDRYPDVRIEPNQETP